MKDIAWMVGCAGLVFMMQAGFMCLESGLTRSKNSINIAAKNLSDFGVSFFLFWGIGYGLMFGSSWLGWLGHDRFAVPFGQDPYLAAFFVFQAMFCSTAATIISGAAAERLQFGAYLCITMLCSGLIYPIYGHWAWNGLDLGITQGWLAQLGFVDFAGSTVVHSVGGWVSLAVILVLGPRSGRFSKPVKPDHATQSGDCNTPHSINIHGSDLPLSVLGVLLLWFGWLGFNGGSTLELNADVPRIIGNTMLAGTTGLLTTGLISWQSRRVPKVESLINGALAGLVAITANCHAVDPILAAVIGVVGGAIATLVAYWLKQARIDDAVDAIPIHLGAGIWGTIAVALFGDPEILGTGLGHWQQMGVQCLGIAIAGIWCFGIAYPLLALLNRFRPLRVTPQEEHLGLNISEHQAKTEIYDLLQVMTAQAQTQDLSLRIPVESFTEAGYIAERYNSVMDALENQATTLQNLNTNLEQAVTERTTELAQANQELQAFDRLKDQFLANTSQELRAPIDGILKITQSLLDGVYGHLAKPTRTNLAFIVQSGERLATLVNDMLDFAQLQNQTLTLNLDAIDLHDVSQNVVELCQILVGNKPIELSSRVQPHLPLVQGDRDRLQQVLYNLVANAIKFTEAGHVQIQAEVEEFNVVVTIVDTGIGIPAERHDRIFESFEQADGSIARNYGGTGLGLSLVKQLVELQGGAIAVESTVGVGSTFRLTLPIAPTVPIAPPQPQKTGVAPQLTPRSPTTPSNPQPLQQRDTAQPTSLLQTLGYWVIHQDAAPLHQPYQSLFQPSDRGLQINNNDELVQLMQEDIPNESGLPDLILLDIQHPTLSAYALIDQLRCRGTGETLPKIWLFDTGLTPSLQSSTSEPAIAPITSQSKAERVAHIYTQLQHLYLDSIYRRFIPQPFLNLVGRQTHLPQSSEQFTAREMSVMFVQLQATNVIAEMLSETVSEPANSLTTCFKRFEELVMAENGYLVHYAADTMVNRFGRNPDDALDAAIAILQVYPEGILEHDSRDSGRALVTTPPTFVQVEIGIHAGPVGLGATTEPAKDALNQNSTDAIASHITSLTKAYGVSLIITAQTHEQLLEPERYHLRQLGQAQIKGQPQPIDFYEVYESDPEPLRSQKAQTQPHFEEAVALYLKQDYAAAMNGFQACLDVALTDTASRIYLERCQKLCAIKT